MDIESEAEELLQRIGRLRLMGGPLFKAHLTDSKFEEFVLALESAEFFICQMDIVQCNAELLKAIGIVEKI